MPGLKELLLWYGPLAHNFNDRWLEARFVDETRGVCALYERLLGRFHNDLCHKLIVCCVDEITDERLVTILGICHVEVPVAVEPFFALPDRDKQRFALDALMRGIDRVIEITGWEREPFQRAHDQVIALDFVNRFMWRRPVASPDRRYTAELWLDHGVHSCDFTIVLRDRRGRRELLKQLVTQQPPDELIFVSRLGRLEWVSHSQVALFGKDGVMQWSVQVPQDTEQWAT